MNWKRNTVSVLLALLCLTVLMGQKPMTKADALYFQYAYQDAIAEYKREMVKKPLTNEQYLNLADSYYQTGNYKGASDTFFEVFKKDSTMSAHHFNKMLQAMTISSGLERTKAILATRSANLSSELMENAEFNFQLLKVKDTTETGFEIININGNSPQEDFSPAYYGDKLLFTSSRKTQNTGVYAPSGESYFQLFVGRPDNQGNIQNVNPYTGVPSSSFHQATPHYSSEIQRLFYISSNQEDGNMVFDDKGKNSLAIAMADDSGNSIFVIKDLSVSFYYPHYDAESERLYFAANIEGGYGGTDLYYALTSNGVIRSAPVNLGPRINSPGNEIAPFIYDGNLYFSSDVFYGLGGMDIYKSLIQEDGQFSIPLNLGSNLNSSDDDFGLIIKGDDEDDGLVGYFTSDRPGGKGKDDIFAFKADKAPGLKTIIINGKVLNASSSDGIPKARIQLVDTLGNSIKEIYTNEEGKYRLEIPYQHPLQFKVDKNRYSSFSETFDEADLDSLLSSEMEVPMKFLDDLVVEKEDQTVIKVKDFRFAKGSSRLSDRIISELDKVVEVISMFPQLQLRIESHTDSRGGSATNFRLSQNRANAMRDYLLENGVASSNILYTIGYGEDKIINQCTNGVYCTETLHRQNERHHFVILNYDLLD